MIIKTLKLFTAASLSLISACTVMPGDIAWGDDTSAYANDGDCDDPRFDGPGAYSINLAADAMHDATDCRLLYDAGHVFLRPNFQPGLDYENPEYTRQNL